MPKKRELVISDPDLSSATQLLPQVSYRMPKDKALELAGNIFESNEDTYQREAKGAMILRFEAVRNGLRHMVIVHKTATPNQVTLQLVGDFAATEVG